VGETYIPTLGIKVIPLTEPWAQRRFVVCYRDFATLQPAAQRMVDHLAERATRARETP
jgi:DNA-binding transcriptional LysR family regulator